MSKNYIISGYHITSDPDFLDDQNALSPELKGKIQRYHRLALEGEKSSVSIILDAIEKYPDNPQIKNYLSVLYNKLGDSEKAYETNHWIVSKHPDYLFGKLNLANEHYLKGEFIKMAEILGKEMDLKALYPHRDTFHINEVTSYIRSTILYFTGIGDLDEAELRCDMLKDIAPDSLDTEFSTQHLLLKRLEHGKEQFKKEQKERIPIVTKKQEATSKVTIPEFMNPEIIWLYEYGLHIDKDKLSTLLHLPKESLISDLELVLQDSIDRFSYFKDLTEKKGWNEEIMNFVVHAVSLLGEIEASKSLNSLFNILNQSEEYIDLYLYDFVTIVLWEPLFKMARNELETCKQFMMKSGIDTYVKTAVSDMMQQLVHNYPERRNEIVNWFKDIIHFYLNRTLDDNVLDSDLIGLMVCDIIDIEAKELLPDIEMLFEKQIVSKGICGSLDSVREAFHNPTEYSKKREILSISERYDEITSTWAGYIEDEKKGISVNSDFDHMGNFEFTKPYVRTELKIGRNDPCPCGSGKKYKNCCLNG
ncbi:MAG: DUF1186 domain-containing protein [Bacteroidales bacterium]|nr:DUF1186 domain-containing protein [Bacteroidales bacterium]